LGETYAMGINNSGHVVGRLGDTTGTTGTGFIFKDGELIDLKTIADPGDEWSVTPFEINDRDEVIGCGWREFGGPRYFMLDLEGNLRFYDDGFRTHDLNNLGEVVGWASSVGGFLDSGGTLTLIQELGGYEIYGLNGINDRGQMIGEGGYMLLFTPVSVPEPAVSLGACLLLLAARRPRRQ